MATTTNEFRTLCGSYKVSDLVTKGRNVVWIDSEMTPKEGFARIVEAKVLSAPVYSKEASAYVGFLDTRDLVSFVVFQAEEKGKSKSTTDTLQVPDLDLPSLLDTAARMPAYTAQNLTTGYLAARNKFIPVSPDDSVLKVVDILRRASVHRVPVVAADGSLIDIISQSTIISFVYAHRAELVKSFTKTVDEVKLGSRPVIPVNSAQTAFDTFKVMDKYNRSGIAVVDEEGRFVGNTSGSDLKLFIQDPNLQALRAPVLDFLAAIRRLDLSDTRFPAIAVPPESTIERVVGKLFATKIHRVFVATDSNGYKPEAVISLTDLLEFLLDDGIPNAIKVDKS